MVLVFDGGATLAELDRHAGFAFVDPLGARREAGEGLLVLEDALTFEVAPAASVDLQLQMRPPGDERRHGRIKFHGAKVLEGIWAKGRERLPRPLVVGPLAHLR